MLSGHISSNGFLNHFSHGVVAVFSFSVGVNNWHKDKLKLELIWSAVQTQLQSLNIESTYSKAWQQLIVRKFHSDEFKNLDLTFKIQK